jgi:hypothetical protein
VWNTLSRIGGAALGHDCEPKISITELTLE